MTVMARVSPLKVRVFETCRLRFHYQYVDRDESRVRPRLRPADTAGSLVHRVLCDACHTMHGSNALVELARTWTDDQLRLNIAKLQRTKGFMPPFAGNAEDVEALVQLLRWEIAGAPSVWAETNVSPEIARWLVEAGTR